MSENALEFINNCRENCRKMNNDIQKKAEKICQRNVLCVR